MEEEKAGEDKSQRLQNHKQVHKGTLGSLYRTI